MCICVSVIDLGCCACMKELMSKDVTLTTMTIGLALLVLISIIKINSEESPSPSAKAYAHHLGAKLGTRRKEKIMQAVKSLPTPIKEKRVPRAQAPCIPFTKRKSKEVKGDQEGPLPELGDED
eukprot:scaffold86546_cov35-Tisochrysis_lutea.AAC.1